MDADATMEIAPRFPQQLGKPRLCLRHGTPSHINHSRCGDCKMCLKRLDRVIEETGRYRGEGSAGTETGRYRGEGSAGTTRPTAFSFSRAARSLVSFSEFSQPLL